APTGLDFTFFSRRLWIMTAVIRFIGFGFSRRAPCMSRNHPVYRSFLLRFWRERGAREAALRAIVVDTQTGERSGFESLDGLVQFLKQEIERLETQRYNKEEVFEENE
ncbi:MAG: hypothetical protein AB1649_32075, partial [Chloroflexota bacterium]